MWIKLVIDLGLVLASVIAYKKQALSTSGAIGFVVIGTLTLLSFKIKGLLILAIFFITANLAGHWPSTDQVIQNKSTPNRTITQVLANGYMVLIAGIGQLLLPSPFWLGMLIGSIVEANADTWASEIGQTSRNLPVSVLYFKKLAHGVSGGVTVKGLIASLGGAGIISICAVFFWPGIAESSLWFIIMYSLLGFIGAYLDSILGECCQVKYRCQYCQQLTDDLYHCSHSTVREKGVNWITNNTVNAISTGITGILGGLILLWL